MTKNLDEFDRIEHYFQPLTRGRSEAFSLRDDASKLPKREGQDWVVSTDTLIEAVHFLGSETPEQLADKLVGVNLSDLAGCGAKPDCAFLTLALPNSIEDEWVKRFSKRLLSWLEHYDFAVLGGDSVSSPKAMMLGLTSMGLVPEGMGLTRLGASEGDLIFVSGPIGDSFAGLHSLQNPVIELDAKTQDYLEQRYYCPEPRVELGQKLIEISSGAMDISDGLIADLSKFAKASDIGFSLNMEAVPISYAAKNWMTKSNASLLDLFTGGDDYELLWTIAPCHKDRLKQFSLELDLPLYEIGHVHKGQGLRLFMEGKAVVLPEKQGFTHG